MWSWQSKKEKFKKTLDRKILENTYPPPSAGVIKVASRRPVKPVLHKIQRITLHARPVGGTNQRVLNTRDGRVRIDNAAEWPNSAHGLITMNFKNRTYWATGIMIGPNIVLTAGHNLYDHEIEAYADLKSMRFLPGMNGDIPPFDDIEVEKYFISPNYITDGKEDYGILVLKKSIGESTGYFGLACLEPEEIKRKTINVIGYPYDKVADRSGIYEMWGMEGTAWNIDQDEGLIKYLIDTTQGQSGSGVWYQEGEDYYICGVHVSGTQSVNSATLLTRVMYQQIHTWLQKLSFKDLPSKFQETKELKFQDQEINAECVSLLMNYKLNQLTCLDISKNQIDLEGMKALAKNDSWTSLVKLDLSASWGVWGISRERMPQVSSLAEMVTEVGSIATIEEGPGMQIGLTGGIVETTFFLFLVTRTRSFSHLYLPRSILAAEGAKGLANNKSWINLSKLNLSFNKIGAEGAKELAKNKSWINLSELNLCGNDIRAEGTKGLTTNSSWTNLSKLNLSFNKIGAKGAKELATNKSWINLSELNLSGNDIRAEGVKGLATNSSWINLLKLNLSFNKINAEGAKELAENKSWINLSELSFVGNEIGADGVKLLRKNKTWKKEIDINAI